MDDAEWLRGIANASQGTVAGRLRRIANRLDRPEAVTDELEALVALADAAEQCTKPPHFIMQPFLGIFRKHGETIAKARAALSKVSPLIVGGE